MKILSLNRKKKNMKPILRQSIAYLALATLAVSFTALVLAQQPGAPAATTSIDGKQLPPPPPNFSGVIKEKASESQASGCALFLARRTPVWEFLRQSVEQPHRSFNDFDCGPSEKGATQLPGRNLSGTSFQTA
jgi:hypothetical protein